jgi:type I restriction enzyme M protein
MAQARSDSAANVGFEAELWKAADALRGNMDPSEYKHIVLGLLFLKYISDAFDERRAELAVEGEGFEEDVDAYVMRSVFWVPTDARWSVLKKAAKQPTIGVIVDNAMTAIERENPALKDVLPRDYARPALDKARLGQLIDMVSNITVGDRASRSKDVLGRTYEYFLSRFASAEGKGAGQFYTPRSVVELLVGMLAPYKGRVFDPCCGSGGMFVQSERFVEEHGGRVGEIAIYGQESNYTTWRLCKMNLAIRGLSENIAWNEVGSFVKDEFPDLKADYVLANPPFNDSDWNGALLRDDQRWTFGVPPESNANFAWVQHFISHLSPTGTAGFVLANGSMSSNQSGEGEIRRNIIEADLVDCMVAMPGQLFYSTPIPVCLWFLSRGKHNKSPRERSGEILFIDARQMGTMADRTHRELSGDDISTITSTYHSWRRDPDLDLTYQDVPGFCRSVSLDEVSEHGFVLTPGRYVGTADVEDDTEPFDDRIKRLAGMLSVQMDEGARLDGEIRATLGRMGHGL